MTCRLVDPKRVPARPALLSLKLAWSLGRAPHRDRGWSRASGSTAQAGRAPRATGLRASYQSPSWRRRGTVLADDPLLTCCVPASTIRPAGPRVVVDRRLRLPATSRLAVIACEVPVWSWPGGGEPAAGGGPRRARASRSAADGRRCRGGLGDARGARIMRVPAEGGAGLAAALCGSGWSTGSLFEGAAAPRWRIGRRRRPRWSAWPMRRAGGGWPRCRWDDRDGAGRGRPGVEAEGLFTDHDHIGARRGRARRRVLARHRGRDDLPLDEVALGASVAHSGVCLTVAQTMPGASHVSSLARDAGADHLGRLARRAPGSTWSARCGSATSWAAIWCSGMWTLSARSWRWRRPGAPGGSRWRCRRRSAALFAVKGRLRWMGSRSP